MKKIKIIIQIIDTALCNWFKNYIAAASKTFFPKIESSDIDEEDDDELILFI